MRYLFWIDLEMTGLDVQKDVILELALTVTDLQLKELFTFHDYVFQPQNVLDGMDDWCKKHHGESGLTQKVTEQGKDILVVEKNLLQGIAPFLLKDEKCVLAGNSIWQDRKFIEKYLKEFASLLHYRMLDVSSLKLIFENIYNKKFQKGEKHRAVNDISESINELKFYQEFIKA